MRRLDGTSAFLIYSDLPRCYQHTLKIAIVNWKGSSQRYDYQELFNELSKAPERFPLLKWKVTPTPLGIHHPIWTDQQEFDISHHIKRIACPGTSDKYAFSNLIAELYAQPLDKSRPLWQMWVVEGLPDDQVAIVTLLHHAYADGAGASMLMQGIISSGDEKKLPSEQFYGVKPNREYGSLTLFLRGLVELPFTWVKHLPQITGSILKQKKLQREYEASGNPLPPSPSQAPDSPLNVVHSYGRTFAYDYIDFDEFRRVSKHFNVTINDLFVAVVAGAVRQFYQDLGVPADKPLVACIPINARTEEQSKQILGNHLSDGHVNVPIHIADPLERLTATSESSKLMKTYQGLVGGSVRTKLLEIMPPFAAPLLNYALKRRRGQLKLLGNLGISNVKGPQKSMEICGGIVEHWLSIGHVTAGVGLNVTGWSYAGKFSICVMADQKVLTDGPKFLDYIKSSYQEYQELASSESN